MDDNELAVIYAAGMKDLVSYRSTILLNDPQYEVEPAPFHLTWSDILLNQKSNFAVEGFRESAKGQYCLRSFNLYALTFPSPQRDYIVIIKNNATHARKIIKSIQDEFLTNPILKRGLVKVNEESSDVFNVDVLDEEGKVHNVVIEGYGKGASIRGLSQKDRRPKIVIIDDPQDGEDCSPTSHVHEKDWDWFNSDVMFLGKYCRIFLIGNNLGERSIIERVFANAEALGFQTARIPVCDKDFTTPAWPSRDSIESIIQERERFRSAGKIDVWMREKMCVAIADELRIFKREDFRYWGRYQDGNYGLRQKMNACLIVDPAASIKESADFRACVVPACDQDENWFVLDISYGRYDMATLIDEIFRLVVFWKLKDVGIEEGVLKSAMEPFLMAEMKKRKVFFNIIPLKAHARKEERIKMMQPRFRAHTILFPEDAPWLSELESELLAFTMEGTKGLHDDLIDALAYYEQLVKKPMNMAEMKNLPRNYLAPSRWK